MSIHDDDQTPGRPPVTERVLAALDALTAEFTALLPEPRGAAERAVRAERLAMICARRAAWWRLLLAAPQRRTLSRLFARAIVAAAVDQQDQARFWRDAASDWRARAERRPTSDAAGAMSNHHDLGIAS